MPQDFIDDQSTLVQVMTWCNAHKATSHYMNQCWPSSMMSYCVTRPQWVNRTIPNNKEGDWLPENIPLCGFMTHKCIRICMSAQNTQREREMYNILQLHIIKCKEIVDSLLVYCSLWCWFYDHDYVNVFIHYTIQVLFKSLVCFVFIFTFQIAFKLT